MIMENISKVTFAREKVVSAKSHFLGTVWIDYRQADCTTTYVCAAKGAFHDGVNNIISLCENNSKWLVFSDLVTFRTC